MGETFNLAMIRGLPGRNHFTHSGIEYTVITRCAHSELGLSMKYSDNTFVAIGFRAGRGVLVRIIGNPEFRSGEPLSVLRVDVTLDGYTAVTNIRDISQIEDERLRAVVREAKNALSAYPAALSAQREAEVARQLTEEERRQREHDRQVASQLAEEERRQREHDRQVEDRLKRL